MKKEGIDAEKQLMGCSVIDFWRSQYKFHRNPARDNTYHGINSEEVFNFYQETNYDQGETFQEFTQQTMRIPGITYLTQRNRTHNYMVTPRTLEAAAFHSKQRNSRAKGKRMEDRQEDTRSRHHSLTDSTQDENRIHFEVGRSLPEEQKSTFHLHMTTPPNDSDIAGTDSTSPTPMATKPPDETQQGTPGSPRSQTTKGEERKRLKQQRNAVSSFWSTHYTADKQSSEVLPQEEVFQLYLSMDENNKKTDLPTFNRLSLESGIKARRCNHQISYHAIPISNESHAMHSQGHQTTICFYLANIQNLITNQKNKSPFLHNLTKENENKRIIALTETSLKKSKHPNTEITKHFQHHHILRQDRKEKVGDAEAEEDDEHLSKSGGCLLLSSNSVPIEIADQDSNGNVELIIAEAQTIGNAIILLYNPPSNFSLNKFKEAIGRVSKYLNKNANKDQPLDIILTGDLNFPSNIVTWEKSDVGATPNPTNGETDKKKGFELLSELAEKHSLTQLVDKTTHKKETLDLLYTSNPQAFSACQTSVIYPESDHELVTFQITTNIQQCVQGNIHKHSQKIPEIATYDFQSANKVTFTKALEEINWKRELGPASNIKNCNKNLADGIVSAAKSANVPKYKHKTDIKRRGDDRVLKTLTQEHNHLNTDLQNNALLTTDRNTKTAELHDTNEAIRDRLDELQEEEEVKIANDIKGNPKAFFAFANRNIKLKSSVGPLKEGKHFYSGPKKMAEILNKQYEGAFSKPLDDYSHVTFGQALCEELNDLAFTNEDIKAAVKAMCSNSAPGPDGISAFLLKEYTDILVIPLHYMWRTSLDTGQMPEGTIQSIITPIFKGGNRSAPKDYRPVALTNHITKVFERVLRKAMIAHIENNNLINDAQHGFRNGRSTISQILRFYDSILTMLDQGQAVDAIYLDFSKAFDKVDHKILLKKLRSVNISGKIWDWIREFLQNREQRVRVNSVLSNSRKVMSGVPQGSVLGPLLFLIMISDIDKDTLDAMVGIFADDTRIWRVFRGE